jgi:dienelactone hydrolase
MGSASTMWLLGVVAWLLLCAGAGRADPPAGTTGGAPAAYQPLGEYSDLVDAARRAHPLWPVARPGGATQRRLRDALAFEPGDEQPQDVRVERTWTRDGVDGQEISWSVGYGPRTVAWLLRPAGVTGKLPGVIALHDHGGFYYYGKEKIADGPDPTPDILVSYRQVLYGGRAYANELARRGFAVLVPDVFLWGSRRFAPGSMNEATPSAGATDMDPAAYNKLASRNEQDVAKYCTALGTSFAGVVSYEDRVAAHYLAGRPDVDAHAIGCIGLSGGGTRAALLYGTCPLVRAAVIVSMMSSYHGLVDHSPPSQTWMLYPPAWARYGDYPDIAACRAPLPLLVQYNRQDRLFSMAGMQEADARIAAEYASVGARGAYTGRFYDGPHKFDLAMQEDAFAWLAAHLGEHAPPSAPQAATPIETNLWDGAPPNVVAGAGPGADDGTGRVRNVGIPGMLVYLPAGDAPPRGRLAVIVCPGGAYTHLTRLVGGDGTVDAFVPKGAVVIALRYRLQPPSVNVEADALADVTRAVRLVRSRAGEWGIDPGRVGVLGWSAGANLALNLATHFDTGAPASADPVERESCRPDFVALLSPWPSTHTIDAYPVAGNAPPAFIASARDDTTAPVTFAEAIAARYDSVHAPERLWVVDTGGHSAFEIGTPGEGSAWPDRFWQWLGSIGMVR